MLHVSPGDPEFEFAMEVGDNPVKGRDVLEKPGHTGGKSGPIPTAWTEG